MRHIAIAVLVSGLLAGCAVNQPEQAPSNPVVAPVAAPQDATSNLPQVAVSEADVLLQDAYRAEERKDMESALPLYEESARKGSAKAHYELARLYAQGADGVVKDLAVANRHLIEASSMGNDEATRVLAWQYLRGAGVEKNQVKAVELFDQAAKTSLRAQREAGMLYVNAYPQYALNDSKKGLSYLHTATQAGDAESAFYLYKTVTQMGAPTDESDAALVMAVQKGYPKALFLAGSVAMKQGKYEQASQIYLKAAMNDDAASMYEYANNVLLKKFKSNERELEACTWFAIAASKNNEASINELVAQAGLRRMLEKKQPGRLDNMIASTKQLIRPWKAE
jgi:TPR repeat protein